MTAPRALLILGVLTILGISACVSLETRFEGNPHYDPSKAHHTPQGFRNPHQPIVSGSGFWRWQWARFQDRLAGRSPSEPLGGWASVLPSVPPNQAQLMNPGSQPQLTWLGHASLLLQVNGVNLLIDPVLSERASPVSWAGPRRVVPAPLSVAELPRIDAVFISHNHYDHLDCDTLRALRKRFPELTLILPLGLKDWARRELGHEYFLVELDWWQRTSLRGLQLSFVPAQHWSRRGLMDTNRSLWGGVVVEARQQGQERPWRFIYTGDTGYSPDFLEICRRFPGGFDAAAIPIGSYEPRWFMKPQHVDPDEAVQIFKDLGARWAVGVHWGTFPLSDEALDEPPRALAKARQKHGLAAETFLVMAHGETRRLGIGGP